jgi:hypothetical protein
MLATLPQPARGAVTMFGTAASKPMRVRRLTRYVPRLLSADALLTGHDTVELSTRLIAGTYMINRAASLKAMGSAPRCATHGNRTPSCRTVRSLRR